MVDQRLLVHSQLDELNPPNDYQRSSMLLIAGRDKKMLARMVDRNLWWVPKFEKHVGKEKIDKLMK